jgi:Putative MetA-pathway of phenol degradation
MKTILLTLALGLSTVTLPVLAAQPAGATVASDQCNAIACEKIESAQNDPNAAVTQTPPAATPSTSGAADVPNISTSRPTFTDTPTTVPKGSYQVESGATYTHNRDDSRSWTLPEMLHRVGLLNNTEWRVTVPNYINIHDADGRTLVNNFGDMSVGLSQHFSLPSDIDLAVIPILNIPTGAHNVSSNAVDPQLRVVWGKSVTPTLSLGGQLDIRWFTDAHAAADVIFNPTLVGYYSWTSQFTSFVEYATFIPTTGKASQFIQTGLLFLATKRQQLDVRVAAGLNNATPDFLVGFGYSFRLDGLFGK